MGRHIKTFANKSFIEYDRDAFDDWCVYFTNTNGYREPPKDTQYFKEIKDLAFKYGADRIYGDFCKIYDLTTKTLSNEILKTITALSQEYGQNALKIDKLFSILYASMIAEENKLHTKLGKRIKRLGMHMLLIEDKSVEYSANFMRGKPWRVLHDECIKRGF